MNKRKIFWIVFDLLFIGLLLGLDQYAKFLAITGLKGKTPYVIWEGVLELQYLENRGTAFGILQNQKIFILFVDTIFMLVILFLLFRLPENRKYNLFHIFLCMTAAGGIGNMVDRVRFDYVVDFISFILIHYPIFNVADCYIVVAVIGLAILFLFVYKETDLYFLNFKQSRYREVK